MPTIRSITDKFFEDNNRVMLYVCDAMDGRAKARQKLFSNWAETNSTCILHRVNIEMGDDIIYCGVVTRADLPERTVLNSEFIDKAENIFTQKF